MRPGGKARDVGGHRKRPGRPPTSRTGFGGAHVMRSRGRASVRELTPASPDSSVSAHELGLLHRDDLRVDRLGAVVPREIDGDDIFVPPRRALRRSVASCFARMYCLSDSIANPGSGGPSRSARSLQREWARPRRRRAGVPLRLRPGPSMSSAMGSSNLRGRSEVRPPRLSGASPYTRFVSNVRSGQR